MFTDLQTHHTPDLRGVIHTFVVLWERDSGRVSCRANEAEELEVILCIPQAEWLLRVLPAYSCKRPLDHAVGVDLIAHVPEGRGLALYHRHEALHGALVEALVEACEGADPCKHILRDALQRWRWN
jgi:hypothetical protein